MRAASSVPEPHTFSCAQPHATDPRSTCICIPAARCRRLATPLLALSHHYLHGPCHLYLSTNVRPCTRRPSRLRRQVAGGWHERKQRGRTPEVCRRRLGEHGGRWKGAMRLCKGGGRCYSRCAALPRHLARLLPRAELALAAAGRCAPTASDGLADLQRLADRVERDAHVSGAPGFTPNGSRGRTRRPPVFCAGTTPNRV